MTFQCVPVLQCFQLALCHNLLYATFYLLQLLLLQQAWSQHPAFAVELQQATVWQALPLTLYMMFCFVAVLLPRS